MKSPDRISLTVASSLVALATALLLSSAQAQTTLTWDPAANGSMSGGNGTWDLTTANWWNGSSDVVWANVGGFTGTIAILKGTAGTVTVAPGGVTVGGGTSTTKSIVAQTSGYTLSGGPLTLDNTGTPTNSVFFQLTSTGAADTLTFNSNLIFKGTKAYTTLFEVGNNSQTMTINGNMTLDTSGATVGRNLQATKDGGNVVINGNISVGSGNGGSTLALTMADSVVTESTLTLTGNNTFGGGVFARRGTIYANSNTALGTGTARMDSGVSMLLTGAAVTIGNNIQLLNNGGFIAAVLGGSTAQASTFNGTITQNTGTTNGQTLLVTAAAGGTVTLSGVISDAANNLAVQKVGDGVVKLTAAAGSSYALGTEVNVGTLLINNTTGSGTGDGAVTVNSASSSSSTFTRTSNTGTVSAGNTTGLIVGQSVTGTGIKAGTFIARIYNSTSFELSSFPTAAGTSSLSFGAAFGTLGGTGIISQATTVNSGAVIAPGDLTTGNLTLQAGLTLNGTYKWEINANSAVSGFDKISLTGGNLALGGASALNIAALGGVDFTNAFWTSSQSWNVVDNSGSGTLSGTFSSLTGTVSNAYGAFSMSYGSGAGADATLNWTAVPEPSTWALTALGLTAAVALRRRRNVLG